MSYGTACSRARLGNAVCRYRATTVREWSRTRNRLTLFSSAAPDCCTTEVRSVRLWDPARQKRTLTTDSEFDRMRTNCGMPVNIKRCVWADSVAVLVFQWRARGQGAALARQAQAILGDSGYGCHGGGQQMAVL